MRDLRKAEAEVDVQDQKEQTQYLILINRKKMTLKRLLPKNRGKRFKLRKVLLPNAVINHSHQLLK
jgi:hypothetical protein